MHFDLDQAHTAVFEKAVGAGTFKLQYCEVPCRGNWAGASDQSTVGNKYPTWGSCPAEKNPPTEACQWQNLCGSNPTPAPTPSPTPVPSGGSCQGLSVNSGSNEWWIGLEGVSSASNVKVNCGDARGWMATSKSSWGAWIWTPQASGSSSPCSRSLSVDVDGKQCSISF